MARRSSHQMADEAFRKIQDKIQLLRNQIEEGAIVFDDETKAGQKWDGSHLLVHEKPDDAHKNWEMMAFISENNKLKAEIDLWFKIIDESVQDQAKRDRYKIVLLHHAIIQLDNRFNNFREMSLETSQYYGLYETEGVCRMGIVENILSLVIGIILGAILFANIYYRQHPDTDLSK